MDEWKQQLKINPIPALMSAEIKPLRYFVQRDLLETEQDPIETLWHEPEVNRILAKQKEAGSWHYSGSNQSRLTENYDLLQTYRFLGILIEQFGLHRKHTAIQNAAAYLFSHQTEEGDIRGIFGAQYTPHYTAGMFELLIKAGYENDPRVEKGLNWFIAQRQHDGGWAWPLRTAKVSYQKAIKQTQPVQTDKSKPFSNALTGFVLRAFAAHPEYKKSEEARIAGELIQSRFFKPDKYTDRQAAHYWTKFQFPFWWANILTVLDSLSWMGFSAQDGAIHKALAWFTSQQLNNGLWPTGYGKGKKAEENKFWVSLAICRMLKRFYK